jgi:hypothetical protein
MAGKIETAAAQFKVFWESGCSPTDQIAVAIAQMTLTPTARHEKAISLDPSFLAYMRAIAQGDDVAIRRLASWLEESGDIRASAVRAVREMYSNETVRAVKVWELFAENLSFDERETLRLWFGITPDGVGRSIQRIAQRSRKSEKTIRHRVDLALHKLRICLPPGASRGLEPIAERSQSTNSNAD